MRSAPPPLELPVDAPIEEQVELYLENQARKRASRGGEVVLAILAGTGALAATHLNRWIEPQHLLVAVGVVLFHELGHFAAMRALGYRDGSIFLIPFLGAADTGHGSDPRPAEELVVLLAGPLPGLLLGATLHFAVPDAHAPPLLEAAIAWLIGFNWITLLPVVPLDGGRVAQLLVTARRPWLEVGLRASVAFTLLALAAGGSILLTLLGILVLVGTRRAYAAAVLRRHLTSAPAQALRDERARVRLVLEAIREQGLESLSSPTRSALATELVRRSGLRSPGVAGTLIGLLTYGACLLAVPAVALAPARPPLGSAERTLAMPGPAPTPFHGAPGAAPQLTTGCRTTGAVPRAIGLAHPPLDDGTWRWTLLAPDPKTARAAALDDARARELLGALADGAEITGRSSWSRLVFLSLTWASPETVDEVDEHTLRAHRENRPGRWLSHPGLEAHPALALACHTSYQEGAARKAAELNRYFDAPRALHLWPPWAPPPEARLHGERYSRTTYFALMDALAEETGAMSPPLPSNAMPATPEGLAAFDRAAERVRRTIDADEHAIRLARGYYAAIGGDELASAEQALGYHLGQAASQELTAVGTAEAWRFRMWIPELVPDPGHPELLIPPLADDLCRTGCDRIDLWLEARRG